MNTLFSLLSRLLAHLRNPRRDGDLLRRIDKYC